MNTNFLHDIHNLDHNVMFQDFKTINNHTYLISTIYLNFNINSDELPYYYETKIFSVGKESIYYNDPMFFKAYSTMEEAHDIHEIILKSLDSGDLKMVKGYFEFISE